MTETTLFNEERSRQVLNLYSTPDTARRRRTAIDALGPQPGERILDVGCGPAVFASEMAERIAPDGRVVGVDASTEMLELARVYSDDHAPGGSVEVRQGDATALPVEDGEFDAAVCVQVLEYVPDVPMALREMHRALRPGGRALIWDTDWDGLMWHSSDDDRMRQVLREWDHHLAHPTLPRTLAVQLREAGFALRRATPYAMLNLEAGLDTYSGGVIGLVESFVKGRETLDGDLIDAWAADLRRLSDEGAYFFCIPAVYFLAEKPA